jgi:hypothetical protein
VTNRDNFFFLHHGVLLTSEDVFLTDTCGVRICPAKLCIAIVVRVAAVRNMNIVTIPEWWAI